MIERLWESGEYQSWLITRQTKASVGVHRALVRWTDGKVRDSHVKIVFDDGGPGRHLANEAAGWLLATALALPVPPFAGFLILSGDQVARAHPGRPRSGDTAAWVTSTEPERTLPITEGMEADDRLTLELRRWPKVCGTCAFDEWIGNSDRYPRNLLRRGENDFVLIDHDYMAGGPSWLPDLLKASTYDDFPNILRDRCSPLNQGDQKPERLFSNAMVELSESFPASLGSTVDQLRDWLTRLMDEDDACVALEDFIRDRADSSATMIRRRYRLLV